MTQHLKLIALLIFTLSASYTSAQSLRKLLERPYGIIESKWEKDVQGATELNYYNEDYYMYRANDRSYNLSNGKNNQKTAWKTTNPQQLLIYHPDQTFAAYLVMNENFIEPGRRSTSWTSHRKSRIYRHRHPLLFSG